MFGGGLSGLPGLSFNCVTNVVLKYFFFFGLLLRLEIFTNYLISFSWEKEKSLLL